MSESGSLLFDCVSKRFKRKTSHDSLRDLIPALFGRPGNLTDFWAVKEVSFGVEPGEVLGIIGHNGAGKSTILKLLNRIIEPTSGVIEVRGRIGSLIEVSAGFHQDLSGRQNVYLQGAIMGMKKVEIDRKFDQIVGFAGLDEFIDTPVKRYSSGMNARLGFSIAAHLEPDVLIIDEVLAVGDHAFQAKAFSKLKTMALAGAPVVLVSHQLDRVAEICTKAILLDHGSVKYSGTPSSCIEQYLSAALAEHDEGNSSANFVFTDVVLKSLGAVVSGEPVTIEFSGTNLAIQPASYSIALRVIAVQTGQHVYSIINNNFEVTFPTPGNFEHSVTLDMNVPEGSYLIQLALWDSATNRDIVRGRQLTVEVGCVRHFWGTAQLNARWAAL